ncbi:MAG: hypothetical protein KGI73_03730 [Patescibacteria group bacterium]|nr:hypothetical protein [Patescibacteria group bacterium]
MQKKHITWVVVIALIVAGVSFYAGMAYGQNAAAAARSAAFANGQFPGGGAAGTRTFRMGGAGGATAGTIIAKDANSITVKLSDGSTKIALVGPSTTVMKTVAGATSDLSVGTTVIVAGSANPDGSMTATNVQIRPTNPTTTGTGTPAGQ